MFSIITLATTRPAETYFLAPHETHYQIVLNHIPSDRRLSLFRIRVLSAPWLPSHSSMMISPWAICNGTRARLVGSAPASAYTALLLTVDGCRIRHPNKLWRHGGVGFRDDEQALGSNTHGNAIHVNFITTRLEVFLHRDNGGYAISASALLAGVYPGLVSNSHALSQSNRPFVAENPVFWRPLNSEGNSMRVGILFLSSFSLRQYYFLAWFLLAVTPRQEHNHRENS